MVESYPGHGAGLRNVGSYQVSGHPFLTGCADMGAVDKEFKVKFPFVTKSITVAASGSSKIRVHFNSVADSEDVLDGGHFISLSSSANPDHSEGATGGIQQFTFDVRCREIYITNITANAQWELYASLTNIHTGSMYKLTGSGLTDGV